MDNPGTEDAIWKGCTCDPMKNPPNVEWNPFPWIEGGRLFTIDRECPLHGEILKKEFD
jgi:hypothetical protein